MKLGAVSRGTVLAVASAFVLSGCQWQGLNSLPLPGTQGKGPGSYEVKIQMPNVTTLTQNSPVMVDDVTVGTITNISVQDWHALVTVSLNHDVDLPHNAVASIGQTSLLGSNHIELSRPTRQPPEGKLKAGDLIPLDRAGVFPTTEQTLSSLSFVLNNGGFGQLHDVAQELNTAFQGRVDTVADLLPKLNELITGLDKQKGQIVSALSGLDRVGKQFADQTVTVENALDKIPPALQVLIDNRPKLTGVLTSLGELSDVAHRIVQSSGDDLRANLADLAPVLKTLADTGKSLTNILTLLVTFPFPMRTLDHAVKGDYLNLMMTVDLTNRRLDNNFLMGTGLAGIGGGVGWGSPALQAGDPVLGPLRLPPGPPR